MLLRSLIWPIEKFLQISGALAGIVSLTLFFQAGMHLKRIDDRIDKQLFKMEISESEASRAKSAARWDYWLLTIYPIVGGGLALVAAACLGQFRRDNAAKHLLETIRLRAERKTGRMPKYVLYLRAFSSTNKFVGSPSVDVSRGLVPPPPAAIPELEREVQKALAWEGKLIALGRPGEHIGVGRIRSREMNWQDNVLLLLEFAKWIVCVPSSEAGILWETGLLFDGPFLSKSLFVMPPAEDYSWKQNHWLLSRLYTPAPKGLSLRTGTA